MSYVRPMLLQAFNYRIFPTTKTWYYKKYTVKTTKNICRGKGSLNGAKQFHNKFSHSHIIHKKNHQSNNIHAQAILESRDILSKFIY
jgi:hypothetical protein